MDKLEKLLSCGIPNDLAGKIRNYFVRFEHQTIEKTKNTLSDAEQQNQELKARVAELEQFAHKIVKTYSWDLAIDGGDVQDWALSAGIIEKVAFDSNVHHDDGGIGLEDGDDYFIFTIDHKQSLAKIKAECVLEYADHLSNQVTGQSCVENEQFFIDCAEQAYERAYQLEQGN